MLILRWFNLLGKMHTELYWFNMTVLWKLLWYLQGLSWKSLWSARIQLCSHTSFRGLCVWLPTTALYLGQPLVPAAKHFSSLWREIRFKRRNNLNKVYIHLLSSSPPPSTFLLRNTSVVIKLTFEIWTSPGSNIISLRVLVVVWK